jgi:hypothetical protein
MVASGTRKARAISSVLSPPSVRSVSATWASSASAGWQLDRGVEVVGLEEEVAAERLLHGDERLVGGHRLAVLHAHGRGRLGDCISTPGLTPGVSLIAR